MRLPGRVLASLLATVLSAAPARAAARPDPQRLGFLLQYVGTDYADAVRDGRS